MSGFRARSPHPKRLYTRIALMTAFSMTAMTMDARGSALGARETEDSGDVAHLLGEPDAVLIQRSQQGRESSRRAAFGALLYRTARLVYCRIYLDHPDHHRAEDLTQEVF